MIKTGMHVFVDTQQFLGTDDDRLCGAVVTACSEERFEIELGEPLPVAVGDEILVYFEQRLVFKQQPARVTRTNGERPMRLELEPTVKSTLPFPKSV